MTAGASSKPCEYVALVDWGWKDETITHLLLITDAYTFGRDKNNHNRPADQAFENGDGNGRLLQTLGRPVKQIKDIRYNHAQQMLFFQEAS